MNGQVARLCFLLIPTSFIGLNNQLQKSTKMTLGTVNRNQVIKLQRPEKEITK
jgi:hypothetical protein